jgi:hypothetical protein
MTAIAEAVDLIASAPAPVFILDSCVYLDLFRIRESGERPCGAEELLAANRFLASIVVSPCRAYLIAPELVPQEFEDNANDVERIANRKLQQFNDLLESIGEDARSLEEAATTFTRLPEAILAPFRSLARSLLDHAYTLDRDRDCLDRALRRLVEKRRPSHNKEIKDSLNLEQALELSRLLHERPFGPPRIFVSSNTRDFARADGRRVHEDLEAEFGEAGLSYSNSLRAAWGSLQRGDGFL